MIDHHNEYKVTVQEDGEIAVDGLVETLSPAQALNLAAWLATLAARRYVDPDGLNVRFAFADLLARVEAETTGCVGVAEKP